MVASTAATRPPRVVYFIASHVNPDQVVRLVRACLSGSPESRVLIHHDYSVSDLDPARLAEFRNVDILRSEGDIGWGAFSMCAMVIRCMTWLLENREFDWVVYISGQDYPVLPPAEIERQLGASDLDGYLDAAPIETLDWALGRERYLYRYFRFPAFRGWYTLQRLVAAYGEARRAKGVDPLVWMRPQDGPRIGFRINPFGEHFRCYEGSSWWTLSRKSIAYMLDYARTHPALSAHYRRAGFAPNESFFLTILRNNPALKLVVDDNRLFIRWTHWQTGHPDLLGLLDVPAMTAAGKFFARKIDERAHPGILDAIDERIGLTPGGKAIPSRSRSKA